MMRVCLMAAPSLAGRSRLCGVTAGFSDRRWGGRPLLPAGAPGHGNGWFGTVALTADRTTAAGRRQPFSRTGADAEARRLLGRVTVADLASAAESGRPNQPP